MNSSRYCSNCDTAVVRSAVGYMCPGCGRLHDFAKAQALPGQPQADPFIGGSAHSQAEEHFTDIVPQKAVRALEQPPTASTPSADLSEQKSSAIKQTMKRLLIPELPAPHYSSALTGREATAALMPSAHDDRIATPIAPDQHPADNKTLEDLLEDEQSSSHRFAKMHWITLAAAILIATGCLMAILILTR